jgi:PKD repeat protein
MKLPWRRTTSASRGQALVEMAVILPVLLLLLLMAVDLGRVFFGWVGLQNAARIGASYAAIHPDAWSAPDNPVKQLARQQYADQMIADAEALNCDKDTNNDGAFTAADLPVPTFTNVVGSSSPYELGDHVSVTLNCTFELITPVVNAIFTGGVPIDAKTTFPVRGGTIANIPTPVPGGSSGASPTAAPCLAPIANFFAAPTNGHKPLTVNFTDTSIAQGCAIDTWAWNFGDGSAISTLQSPSHTYTVKGNYDVTLTVTSAAGPNSTVVNNYIKVQP